MLQFGLLLVPKNGSTLPHYFAALYWLPLSLWFKKLIWFGGFTHDLLRSSFKVKHFETDDEWWLLWVTLNYLRSVCALKTLPPLVLLQFSLLSHQVIGVHLNKWVLDRRLGLACLLMYAVFLCFSILIEFNVFIFVNLPMCRDIHWSPSSSSSSSSPGWR